MRYFQHVRARIEAHAQANGIDIDVHEVPTLPTAALDRRAERLAEVIAQHANPDDRIVLVGHSTGGIDARMVASPTAGLGFSPHFLACRPAIRRVLGVAAPHLGSPLANYFASLNGERMLRLLSVLTLSLVRLGSFRTASVRRLMRSFDVGPSDPGLWDSVVVDVLSAFDGDAHDQLVAFFGQVRKDRSLLYDLSPGAMAVRQPRLQDADAVDYGSLVTCAPASEDLPHGAVNNPTPSEKLFRFLHRRCAEAVGPRLEPEQLDGPWAEELARDLGRALRPNDNDGFVPVASQLHGEVVAARCADHLDILGYCVDSREPPVHANWLRSHSGFTSQAFEATWARACAWLFAD